MPWPRCKSCAFCCKEQGHGFVCDHTQKEINPSQYVPVESDGTTCYRRELSRREAETYKIVLGIVNSSTR